MQFGSETPEEAASRNKNGRIMKLFNLEKSILLNTKSSWLIGVLNALHRRLQANPPVRSGQPPPAREISRSVFAGLR